MIRIKEGRKKKLKKERGKEEIRGGGEWGKERKERDEMREQGEGEEGGGAAK